MAKYSKKASEKVGEAVREMKRGELTIGNSDKKVKSRKQAIAIGLSEARKAGAKAPKKSASKKWAKKATKKRTTKKATKKTTKKKSSKKSTNKK